MLLTTRVDSASPSTSSATMNSGLPACDDLLEQRQEVGDGRDLVLDDEDVAVLDDGLHALGVGDEVGREVALVELHALGEVELERGAVGLLDGDDAVLADLVERLGDELADRAVLRGDGRDVGDLVLAGHVAGDLEQAVADGLDGRVDAALEVHRGATGGDDLEALADHRLGEDGRGGGAVTGDVVGLGGDLLRELGAEVLVGVLELDLAGDGHAVVGDRGGAPLLVDDDVAALRAERHLDDVGERVDAALEAATRVLVELQDLGHGCVPFLRVSGDVSAPGPGGRRGGSRSAVREGRDRRAMVRQCRAGRAVTPYYLTTTASTSRADSRRYSWPSYLTSVPPYFQ